MKRTTTTTAVLIMAALALLFGLLVGRHHHEERTVEEASASSTVYMCPMHPRIVRDEPGKCPICQMDLSAVSQAGRGAASAVEGRAAVRVPAERRQQIGVTFGSVETRDLERVLRASGRVAYDPELYSAIEEHRQALETARALPDRGVAGSILRSTKMKLRLLGLSETQIEELAEKPRGAESSLVLGRAGGSVWVYAEVYEHEMNLVKAGQAMEITSPALPGEVHRARVLAVDSVVNPLTRAARVRAELSNPLGRFKPGMYVQANIRIPMGRRLALPREAVLDTGERQIVFVAEGELFEPREVRLGAEAEGFLVVIEGLKEGERVVTSANFLIDSESQYQAALEAFKPHRH